MRQTAGPFTVSVQNTGRGQKGPAVNWGEKPVLQRSMEKKRSGQGGFTLVELLVVIAILGILAAIVVFAVAGVGDKGQASANKTTCSVLQTAEEGYYREPDAGHVRDRRRGQHRPGEAEGCWVPAHDRHALHD